MRVAAFALLLGLASPSRSEDAVVAPTYPPAAAKARMSGLVTLEFTVNADGTGRLIRLTSSNPLLAQAVQRAFAESRFEPATGAQELTFEFQLSPSVPGLCANSVRQVGPACYIVATVPPEIPPRGGCVFPPPFVSVEPNSYTFYSEALRRLPLQ